jgi:hypothetical protein
MSILPMDRIPHHPPMYPLIHHAHPPPMDIPPSHCSIVVHLFVSASPRTGHREIHAAIVACPNYQHTFLMSRVTFPSTATLP